VLTQPGFPVDVVGTTELHATFREESRTSLLSASAALKGNPGMQQDFSWSRRAGTTPRDPYQATVVAKTALTRSRPRERVLLYSSKSPGLAAGVEMVRSLI
jgi:hypothetical protein